MRLDVDEASALLAAHDHGVLCTVHPIRGVDAVPVAHAVDADGYVSVPVDVVKAKTTLHLQRERNLEADPRATLLAERWDGADWDRLWWVRAELRWQPEIDPDRQEGLSHALCARYAQYAGRPWARLIVLRVVGLTGWAAPG